MLIRKPEPIPASTITPEHVFLNRRRLLGAALATPLAAHATPTASYAGPDGEAVTPEAIVTSYSNFYEFGLDKGDPARCAHEMRIDP
jgi:methionine sulfoxide reductase catalytic subunit